MLPATGSQESATNMSDNDVRDWSGYRIPTVHLSSIRFLSQYCIDCRLFHPCMFVVKRTGERKLIMMSIGTDDGEICNGYE